ncbi:hypothetical protein V502_06789 [Pseudogymnoascus sp. VKM F-4520 (FW-2644)]|nr:hypothetical protein V502_06789 [Pseudogymnoascus sp. VKM F-4520 (FW-2644)]
MACTKETVKANGLNIWSTGAPPGSTTEVDIIGVQGLGSDPFYTWVKKVHAPETKKRRKIADKLWTNGQNGTAELMWPRDLLVPLFTNARVATYSYKSGKGVKTTLRQLAEQFLNVLFQHRQKPDERQRPLVLIGHSLGGLVIQQALVIAALNQDFRDIRLSVSGIIFLGAPFQGSNAAMLGKRLAQVTGGDLSLLELLQKDNPNLHSLSKDFCDSHHEWDFVCFYENTDADYALFKTRVVTASSATLSGRRMIFLNTDHSGLNKFTGKNDENYAWVLPEIQRMVDNGPLIVTSRYQSKEGESAGNKHWLVPRKVNKLFTGRSEIINRIKVAIRDNSAQNAEKQKVFVITGLGGLGKSEICLQVATVLREEFWGVFWVDINSDSTAKTDFISAAAAFRSSAESIDDARRLFANMKHSWLLILDNADNPKVDYQAYFPSGSRGVVIMTSRVSDCSQYSTVGSEELSGLDIHLSKQLLLKAANIAEDLWPSVDQQAEDIANLVCSHTLALIQAGKYVAEGHSRLDQYPEVYVKHRERLLKYQPSQAQSRYGDVYATFEASAHVLERSESEDAKDALRLLGILSMLHASALPLQMFEYAWERSRVAIEFPEFMEVKAKEWDPYRLNKASYLLASLSFVVRCNSSLSMHPLAHAWAKDRQELGQQQKTDLLPHVQSLLSNIEVKTASSLGPKAMVISIFFICVRNLLKNRDDSRLNNLLHDIFGTLAITYDEPSMEYLPIYDLYARNLHDTGDVTNALKLQMQIVNLQEGVLPVAHPDRLASRHELARAYLGNGGQVEKAIELLEHVVKIREKVLPITHPNLLASQHELARAYLDNGQVEKAIELLEHVVKIREEVLPTHPDRLASQQQLAQAYHANGQVEKAIELLEHVVKIREEVLPITDPRRLMS